MRRALAVLCLGVALAACARPVNYVEVSQSVEGQVWSPYCPGRLLIDCTTNQARELRAEIERRAMRGHAPDKILGWVEDEFGPEAIARPSGVGGLVIWLIPALVFLIGLVVVVRVVRRARDVPADV